MESQATQGPAPPVESAPLPVISEYIGIRPGYCGGEPHILGHRIKVRHVVVWHERLGMSPTEIAATYPTITLSQVHKALAYFYDHRAEIYAAIEEEERFVERMKANAPPSKLQNLVQARKANAPDDLLPPG
jgi:uncharacterized protein (DUF433 family)